MVDYIKLFETMSEYEAFTNSEEFVKPNVSYVKNTNEVKFNPNAASANLIEFTVDGISYQAEEGMTWQDFVDSNYNDGYVVINRGYVNCGGARIDNEGSYVLASDVIVNGRTYNRAPM